MSETLVNSSKPIPVVDDSDIEVVEQYLGVSFDAPRRKILRSNKSFDVQACPGSGKTTLLVAKLAILGTKWPHAHRGICVLSHTNVARQEIESRLSGTAIGHRLLTYPHFVGTIHGFVNEYLALPLLRSEGYHISLIDDDACFDWIKHRLMSWPIRSSLGNLPYREIVLDNCIRALVGANNVTQITPPSGINKNQWDALLKAKNEAIKNGIWYYSDMFAWANKLLIEHPEVVELARWRFPTVFLDETQDTSELQGSLLNKIFPISACNLRQRFGDSNQAIYDFGQQAATTDRFPSVGFRSLPDSQRFGPSIAIKTHSLAVIPMIPSLIGGGPRKNLFPRTLDPKTMKHTIFLFTQKSAQKVLPAFGNLLLQIFTDDILRNKAFLARAIGRVARSKALDSKVPRHLVDYLTTYEPRAAKLEPRPEHLVDYIYLAQRKRVAIVDCAESIMVVIKGIYELIRIIKPTNHPYAGKTSRWLWDALQEDKSSIVLLRSLLWEWCVKITPIFEDRWTEESTKLRCALNPIIGMEWNSDADTFCQWPQKYSKQMSRPITESQTAPNCYQYHQEERYVDIMVGTIHSAKGQTHTATLVLESYFKKHDIEDLFQWLCGKKCGADSRQGTEQLERMRLVYTAMTRPSHLLCLAMRRNVINRNGTEAEIRQQFKQLGWSIKDLDACEGVS